jgi:hypothetical protein
MTLEGIIDGEKSGNDGAQIGIDGERSGNDAPESGNDGAQSGTRAVRSGNADEKSGIRAGRSDTRDPDYQHRKDPDAMRGPAVAFKGEQFKGDRRARC